MDNMDALMDRAMKLLPWMSDTEAATHLVESGEDPVEVYFAIKAAELLLKDVA